MNLLVNIDVDDLEKASAFYCEGLAYGKLALLVDPFGNGFCLLQFTGRGYDEMVA